MHDVLNSCKNYLDDNWECSLFKSLEQKSIKVTW